jgi:hypothetical protein
MVELVTLCGYYTLVSFLLNAFDVPLPPGAVAQWAHTGPPQNRRSAPSSAPRMDS